MSSSIIILGSGHDVRLTACSVSGIWTEPRSKLGSAFVQKTQILWEIDKYILSDAGSCFHPSMKQDSLKNVDALTCPLYG